MSGSEPMDEDPDVSVRSIALRVQELSAENERLFRDVVAAERRFRSLSRSAWAVQEDERRRLARELHDGIGQILTALKLQLENARSARGDEAKESIARALEMAAQALDDTRELSRLLRPAVLDDLGLEPALRWLSRTMSERFGITVDLDVSGLEVRLDRELETLAFRIVQEALTNVAKHAGTSAAQVGVSREPSRLAIRIVDQGRGFDPKRPGDGETASVGLRGMRDRAELFGGLLQIESRPGQGTRIDVTVPL